MSDTLVDTFERDVRAAKQAELADMRTWAYVEDEDIAAITLDIQVTLRRINEFVDGRRLAQDFIERQARFLANLGTELAAALTGNTNLGALKEHEASVLITKHHDYGPHNIANSPGGAMNGLRVRLHDKLARLQHLTSRGADPEHESLADTALDVANYGTIMGMVLRGEWPSS